MHNQGEGDADNNKLLLSQLKNIPQSARSARFVCSLALSNPKGEILLTASDCVEGEIIDEARGDNGFGYDPLFFFASMGKTTAQLAPTEKHAISHRGKALRKLQKLMQDTFKKGLP
jgi:XTP/dITP diphosphohydrolase